MKYHIRKVNIKSKRVQNTLLRLQREILPATSLADVTCDHWWILYSETNKPVGFAGMKQSEQFADCVYFHRAGVCDEHTGKKLQRRLIKARLRKAKAMGFNWAVTDTRLYNCASSNSLINCGFKMYKPSRPWGFDDACYWRLALLDKKRSV